MSSCLFSSARIRAFAPVGAFALTSAPPATSVFAMSMSPRVAAPINAVSPRLSSFTSGFIPAARNAFTAIASPLTAAVRNDFSSNWYPRSFRNCLAPSGVGVVVVSVQPLKDSSATTSNTPRQILCLSVEPLRCCRRGTRGNHGAIDADGFFRLVTIFWRCINGICHLHSFPHFAKRRKLSVEVLAFGYQYKEVSTGTVWFLAARHRNYPTNMFDEAGFVRKFS